MPLPLDDLAPVVLGALRVLGVDVSPRRPPTWRVTTPGGNRHDYPVRPTIRLTSTAAALLPTDGHLVIAEHLPEPAAPCRTVADRSTASLGTVQAVLEELRSRGHLEVTGARRRSHRTGALLDRWVEAHAVRTAPRLTLARFDAREPTWWRGADEDLRADGAVWSGEVAAHLLDPHLRPARSTLYAPALPRRTVLAHELRKAADEGDVLVRETFWNWPQAPGSPLAPAPLVYADLVATGDPRCLDAAARLRSTDDLLRHLDGS